MSLTLAVMLAGTIVPIAELPPSTVDPCKAFERQEHQQDQARPMTAADLVGIGDIGRSDPHESSSPFGVSPDGKKIAFLVRRANAQENDYCQKLMVAPIDAGSAPIEVDRGGTFIRADFPLRKFVSLKSGFAKIITPKWSPNGSQIAFLKQEGPTHQVWLVTGDGKEAAYQVTSLPDNVDDFAWVENGKALVVATRPGIRLQAEAIAKEGRSGFLFDERFAPSKAERPIPTEPVKTVYHTVDLVTRKETPSTEAEIALILPPRPDGVAAKAQGFVKAPTGISAWHEPIYPKRLISAMRPVMQLANGKQLTCDKPHCIGTRQLWWSKDGDTLTLRQKNGWGGSQTALLVWKADQAEPRQTMVTDDVLVGCEMAAKELICAREGVTRPRRLVAINPETGRERVIFDPNPEFQNIKLGKVQRLRFRNAIGIESWADLVLPPGHKAGEKHPLILVQYFSQGFLRGGVGDEFPIQPLAAKGFAVLSFARPDLEFKAETERELMLAGVTDWKDRRSVQSALEIAVEHAIETGTVDRDRMGISGFSEGSTATLWALINSSLFKVAALGSCCQDMLSYALAGGPTFTQTLRDAGYRFFEADSADFWKPMSLALNADRIDAPILVQSGDSEYEIGLDVAETFMRRGKPFELYVLENEPHYKYQPAHRLAIYNRSAEWFEFWLMNRMNCDPAKADQYTRWKAMKGAPLAEKLQCEAGTSAAP